MFFNWSFFVCFFSHHFTKHHVYSTFTSYSSVAILFIIHFISCQSISLKSVSLLHTLISVSFTRPTHAFIYCLTHSSLPYLLTLHHIALTSSTHRCLIYFTHSVSSMFRFLPTFPSSLHHLSLYINLLPSHPFMISPHHPQTVWRGGRACSVGGRDAMWAVDGRARGALRRSPRRHPRLRPGRTRASVSPSH